MLGFYFDKWFHQPRHAARTESHGGCPWGVWSGITEHVASTIPYPTVPYRVNRWLAALSSDTTKKARYCADTCQIPPSTGSITKSSYTALAAVEYVYVLRLYGVLAVTTAFPLRCLTAYRTLHTTASLRG